MPHSSKVNDSKDNQIECIIVLQWNDPGDIVGSGVGAGLSAPVGEGVVVKGMMDVGAGVSGTVGELVGDLVGAGVGDLVGAGGVGAGVGELVGSGVGYLVGSGVGYLVGSGVVGYLVGADVGELVRPSCIDNSYAEYLYAKFSITTVTSTNNSIGRLDLSVMDIPDFKFLFVWVIPTTFASHKDNDFVSIVFSVTTPDASPLFLSLTRTRNPLYAWPLTLLIVSLYSVPVSTVVISAKFEVFVLVLMVMSPLCSSPLPLEP